MTAMFRSMSVHNYRLWFVGGFVSSVGTWMQATAQDWVVLTALTDHDALAMGATMALQFGPPLLLVSVAGWVADRFDRRRVLFVTQTSLLLLALALGALVLTGVMTLGLMLALAAGFGVVNAFDGPARAAIVTDIVPREHAANAIALNSATIHSARLIGPAAAGLLIVGVGAGWVFIINAATFLVMLLMLMLMRTDELQHHQRSADAPRLADGFRYVFSRPDLCVVLAIIFTLCAFGMNFPIFASTMAIEFGWDADGYGTLSSALAVGSLAGALMAARRDRARMRVILLGTGGFGFALALSAVMPDFATYGITLVLAGFASVTLIATANGYIQTTTPPALRGRVLAIYMAVILGSTPFGAPLAGWLTDAFGPRIAIAVGGGASILAFVGAMTWALISRRAGGSAPGLPRDEPAFQSTAGPSIEPEDFADTVASTAPLTLPPLDVENRSAPPRHGAADGRSAPDR